MKSEVKGKESAEAIEGCRERGFCCTEFMFILSKIRSRGKGVSGGL